MSKTCCACNCGLLKGLRQLREIRSFQQDKFRVLAYDRVILQIQASTVVFLTLAQVKQHITGIGDSIGAHIDDILNGRPPSLTIDVK